MKRLYIILKNRTLLFMGFTLYNKRGHTFIKFEDGKYKIQGNSRFGVNYVSRMCPYSMDNESWEILK